MAKRCSFPVIRISQGSFFRHHPQTQQGLSQRPARPLFSGLDFEIASASTAPQSWYVVGPSLSGKTTFLEILQGKYICVPARARTYPYLNSDAVPHHLRTPLRAVQYVGFDASGAGGGLLGPASSLSSPYLAARYESRRETTDFSLRDYLRGNTQLNADVANAHVVTASSSTGVEGEPEEDHFLRVVDDLRLADLLDLPATFLSNGQTRRARIARALLQRPEVLLLDEPFMGLDPPTVSRLSHLLGSMAGRGGPRLVLSASQHDEKPPWITHVVMLARYRAGKSSLVESKNAAALKRYHSAEPPLFVMSQLDLSANESAAGTVLSTQPTKTTSTDLSTQPGETTGRESPDKTFLPFDRVEPGEPIVELAGCRVQYGDKVVLGDWVQEREGRTVGGLYWAVRRGESWGVFGPNGSGKTTLMSLLCADHPQAYSQPIKLFGRSRWVEPGSPVRALTYWDVQACVGHSSSEVHAHMPRSLTVRQVLDSAWASTVRGKPSMDYRETLVVNATLGLFKMELRPELSNPNTPGAGIYRYHGSLDAATQHWRSTPTVDFIRLKDYTNPIGERPAWADATLFGELSFSAQRVLLLLRAIIAQPELIVLDEAFSGMDKNTRRKCVAFIRSGFAGAAHHDMRKSGDAKTRSVRDLLPGMRPWQSLVCISHVRDEVPFFVNNWLCLPEAGTGRPARVGRMGRSDGGVDRRVWNEIWGMGGEAQGGGDGDGDGRSQPPTARPRAGAMVRKMAWD